MSATNEHVERARQIADALDSPDREKTLYEQFHSEFKAWEAEQLDEDRQPSTREFDRLIGRTDGYTRKIVRGVTSGARAPQWGSGTNVRTEVAEKVLRDPEQRKQVIASLSAEQIEEVIAEAQDVAVERVRAQRSEHDVAPKEPTVTDLMGGARWDPSESWMDTLLIRCNRNLRELAAHVEKWGPVLGSMPIDEAYEYINETERLAAEVRVALQEQIRDRAEV